MSEDAKVAVFILVVIGLVISGAVICGGLIAVYRRSKQEALEAPPANGGSSVPAVEATLIVPMDNGDAPNIPLKDKVGEVAVDPAELPAEGQGGHHHKKAVPGIPKWQRANPLQV